MSLTTFQNQRFLFNFKYFKMVSLVSNEQLYSCVEFLMFASHLQKVIQIFVLIEHEHAFTVYMNFLCNLVQRRKHTISLKQGVGVLFLYFQHPASESDKFQRYKFNFGDIHKLLLTGFLTPPPLLTIFYIIICSMIDIWLTPSPLACQHSLWMPL